MPESIKHHFKVLSCLHPNLDNISYLIKLSIVIIYGPN